MLIILKIKVKARTVVGRGEEGPQCDPGSKLLLGRERESSARILSGIVFIFDSFRHPVPASVPIRHPRETQTLCMSQTSTQTYTSQALSKIPYNPHACGARVVFVEHGGGSLGIFESPVFVYDQS